jgi:hypothetical protein
MSEFTPDYSSPEAMRASYLKHAEIMRQAAAESPSETGREAFTEEAEFAERKAERMMKP